MDHTFALEKQKAELKTRNLEYDPSFIDFSYWTTLLNLENKLNSEIQKDQNIFFINGQNQCEKGLAVSQQTPIILKNDNDVAILDFSIFCDDTLSEIFYLRALPPQKTIELKFKKYGSYFFNCWQENSQIKIKGTIEIFPSLGFPKHLTKSFSSNFTPNWY